MNDAGLHAKSSLGSPEPQGCSKQLQEKRLAHDNGCFVLAAIYSNLGPSARDLVDDVHQYMEEVLWKLISDVTVPFPRLTSAVKALVRTTLIKTHF